MQNLADFIHVACHWRPRGYTLHATGGHSGKIHMRLAASRVQTLHALAASCVQSFLQARCENNYLNKKMKTPLKILRIYATHVLAKAYPLTLCMA
jgi:hypothetical protein